MWSRCFLHLLCPWKPAGVAARKALFSAMVSSSYYSVQNGRPSPDGALFKLDADAEGEDVTLGGWVFIDEEDHHQDALSVSGT